MITLRSRLICLFSALILGGFLLYFAPLLQAVLIHHDLLITFIGAMILFLTLIGPTHLLYINAQLAHELKMINTTLGVFLPIIGFCLLVFGCFQLNIALLMGLRLSALLYLFIALWGLICLKNTRSETPHVNEIVSVLKDGHYLTKSKEDYVEKLYSKWSKGPLGLPINTHAPNGQVITLEGEVCDLLGYFDQHDPHAFWVLNFASYTCPHHRQHLSKLDHLNVEWSTKGVQFLTLYTAEAHPEDEWQLKVQNKALKSIHGSATAKKFVQPKSLGERIKMARFMIDTLKTNIPIVVDNMQNTLLKQYNSWPIRLYIIKDKRIIHTGGQGPFGYDPRALSQALNTLVTVN